MILNPLHHRTNFALANRLSEEAPLEVAPTSEVAE